jgi:3-oxoacyl-(acyl-carrier-protein) synthase
MSIVRRNGEGKLKPDWSVIVTLFLFLAGGVTSSLGAYYAVTADLQHQRYRLSVVEQTASTLTASVATIQLKDAGDSVAFSAACSTLNEIKKQVDEIRDNQKRLQRKE